MIKEISNCDNDLKLLAKSALIDMVKKGFYISKKTIKKSNGDGEIITITTEESITELSPQDLIKLYQLLNDGNDDFDSIFKNGGLK